MKSAAAPAAGERNADEAAARRFARSVEGATSAAANTESRPKAQELPSEGRAGEEGARDQNGSAADTATNETSQSDAEIALCVERAVSNGWRLHIDLTRRVGVPSSITVDHDDAGVQVLLETEGVQVYNGWQTGQRALQAELQRSTTRPVEVTVAFRATDDAQEYGHGH